MRLEVDSSFIEEMKSEKNSPLTDKIKEFLKACDEGSEKEFMKENPLFVEAMMQISMSDKIKIVKD